MGDENIIITSSNEVIYIIFSSILEMEGVVEKVQKKISPQGWRKEGWRKKAYAACPRVPGLKLKTYCILGEGPLLHTKAVIYSSKPFRGI